MYKANGCLKLSEEDIYGTGCDPDTSYQISVDICHSSETVEDLIDTLLSWYGPSYTEDQEELDDHVMFWDNGRVDIQTLEREDGSCPTQNDIDKWKEGTLRLWAVTYIFDVVEEVPWDLTREFEGRNFNYDYWGGKDEL